MTKQKTFTYKSPDNKKLGQLVKDVLQNKVFITTKEEDMNISFMVLKFMDKNTLEEIENAEIVAVYEYYDRAIKMSINGLPVFTSCNFLSRNDYKRFCKLYKNAENVLSSIFGEDY
jgi:hypothetical protein